MSPRITGIRMTGSSPVKPEDGARSNLAASRSLTGCQQSYSSNRSCGGLDVVCRHISMNCCHRPNLFKRVSFLWAPQICRTSAGDEQTDSALLNAIADTRLFVVTSTQRQTEPVKCKVHQKSATPSPPQSSKLSRLADFHLGVNRGPTIKMLRACTRQ